MSKDRNAFIAGLFIIASFALGATVLVLIRGQGMAPARIMTASFKLTDDLGGLAVGDDVRIGGIKVGVVRDLRFVSLDGRDPHLLVRFTLPSDTTLHEDAVIRAQNGITGTSNLNIESLGTGKPLAERVALVGMPDPKTAFLNGLPKVNE